MAGFIPADEHRQYEEDGRFAFAVFRSVDYEDVRGSCEFLRYLTDEAHCTRGATDAFGFRGTSSAYSCEMEFTVTHLDTLVIECFDLERLDQTGIDKFEDEFCDGLLELAGTECIHGAVVEYSKYAQMSYWVASIADPRHIQIPEEGCLSCNGPLIIHDSRFRVLEPYLRGPFNRRANYIANW